jgi:exosortase
VVAFFVGLYGLTGIAWGFQWLRSSFFPFFLFAFCLPLSGGISETISFPLRLFATKITAVFSQAGLGISVIQDGSRIFDASGSYQYEVAAACSGMRSLTATVAMALIYAFVAFKSPWRRALMIASAVPFAVAANVVRLTTIIVASELWGQEAGNYVHNSSWLSLLPYIPAMAGILILGHLIREDRPKAAPTAQPLVPAQQSA